MRIHPDSGEALDARAMILSVCPEAKCRDGPKAVESATRAD
jgi:hypothetical protein